MASFDDFGRAMLMLYVTSSGDHWGDQMFSIMGVVGRGHAPMRDDFSPNALFMIAWIFFGFIFVRNLFVGVIAESFARQHREDNHVATMTPEQDQQYCERYYASHYATAAEAVVGSGGSAGSSSSSSSAGAGAGSGGGQGRSRRGGRGRRWRRR
jgi:uncharacterized membrane protein YgcG